MGSVFLFLRHAQLERAVESAARGVRTGAKAIATCDTRRTVRVTASARFVGEKSMATPGHA